jgi:hypothetical protein
VVEPEQRGAAREPLEHLGGGLFLDYDLDVLHGARDLLW